MLLWGRADPHAGQLLDHAHRHRLAVVVDACQALGTTTGGRQAGLGAAATCFSTQANKILATGEGGFLATDDDMIAAHARAYRSHWAPAPPGEAPLLRPAHNFRLAGPLAALARTRLRDLNALVDRRRSQANLLLDLLTTVPQLAPVAVAGGWNSFAPLLRLHLDRPRAFCEHLAAHGVPNSTGTFGLVPLDRRPAFHNPARRPCRAAAEVLDTTLAVVLTGRDDDHRIRRYAAAITQEAARWADA